MAAHCYPPGGRPPVPPGARPTAKTANVPGARIPRRDAPLPWRAPDGKNGHLAGASIRRGDDSGYSAIVAFPALASATAASRTAADTPEATSGWNTDGMM